jgi:hypothetical protein
MPTIPARKPPFSLLVTSKRGTKGSYNNMGAGAGGLHKADGLRRWLKNSEVGG